MSDKDELGRRGEQAAAEYLERAGLRILDRNWRCETGELDIVALERRVLVVCEVKTRSGLRYGSPLEAVSHRKRRLAERANRQHYCNQTHRSRHAIHGRISATVNSRVQAIRARLRRRSARRCPDWGCRRCRGAD